MAFNEFQIEELKKIEGFGKGFEKGEKVAADALAGMALLAIPGLGNVKLARTGGKLTKSAMDFVKRAKKMYPNAKINPTPTANQVSNAKPISGVTLKKPADVAVSALKPRPRATAPGGKPTTTAAPKPKVRVPAGTAAKPAPKATAPKPKPKPSAATIARTRKSGPATRGSAKKPSSKRVREADKILAGAAIVGGAAALQDSTKPKKAAAGTRKPTGTYERRAVETSKPKRKPTGTYDRKAVETGKPKRKPTGTYDRTPVATSRPKPVTAGANVGFGPKGNIFPKDAADRRRLMAKYGGTGSAAAKAAAAGKQGNLKKKK